MTIVVSDNNEGPVVNIAAWFGTTVMVLGVCTRMWSKYSAMRKWALDDALVIVTMLLGCSMTVTITLAVANGLGTPQSSLTDYQTIRLQKYGYASQLLYIPALCLTKMTTLVYLHVLSPECRFQTMNMTLEAFTILWSLAAEFAIAFQCQLPSPWAAISGKCFNTDTFWRINGGFDIVTDVMIVFLPLYLVWSLGMPWRRKGVVVMAFGSRLLVIPFTAWRIYSFSAINRHDQTRSLYYVYLTTTIQLNFAIFMACVTFLRPFLESTASGGLTTVVNSTKTSSTRDTLSSLFSSQPRSEYKVSRPKPSYAMQNLSEVGLNETLNTTPRKSDSNTNGWHTDAPSINSNEINHPAHIYGIAR
ncbi:uncharacterized protein LY89DRAFT_739485 [Mollisia scopiformis]|uniref:Rhodopsin domain-containing protein n=1 Tax=Mollisia scopiformis TaxID=149040 RepID=A0A194WUE5_MOLSC|nr:uncharacterized protein LY89DRAFT_739485 [Mollisia scopiformis]KUJ11289.1 hypothetical protein LY89DRAFT_739485 [Mollisia scopiformis]